eukprot:9772423-Alexandrium_andersonii.AAC.1
MSASLVGSEMCIRDRRVLLWQARTPSAGMSAELQALSGSRGAVNVPVSYTHLTLPTICSV